jgi:hypothetical protein
MNAQNLWDLMRPVHLWAAFGFIGTACGAMLALAATPAGQPQTISLTEHARDLDLDDMLYFKALRRVVVPGAQTGNLHLIDPTSNQVTAVSVVKPSDGDEGGVTSAALDGKLLFTADVGAGEVAIVDLPKSMVVGRAKMAGKADYMRLSASTNELWITEPREEGRIEIFSIVHGQHPGLTRAAVIAVPGGPEALVLDESAGVAFTNTFGDKTMMINIKDRSIRESWSNGCGEYKRMAHGARGLAYDESAHILYVACMQGKVIGLDVHDHGKIVANVDADPSVDMIAFNANTHHLFVPSTVKGVLTVFAANKQGALTKIAQYATAVGSHCVITNGDDQAYACDPQHGQVIVIADSTESR